jgi:hypothetical protein
LRYGRAVTAVQVVIRDSWIPTAITVVGSLAGVLIGVLLSTRLNRRSTLAVTRELQRLERQDESLAEIGRVAGVGIEGLNFWLRLLQAEPDPSQAHNYNPNQVASEIPEPAQRLLKLWRDGARLHVSDRLIRAVFEWELPVQARSPDRNDGEEMMEAARGLIRTLETLDDRIVALVGPRPDDSGG